MKTLWPSADALRDLSDHQRDTCGRALAGPIAILTGGPGVGKTRTAGAILKAVVEQHGIASLAAASPTGKAAVRLTASMQSFGLALEATTIHRMLGVERNGHDGKGWGFRYCRANPLNKRFVVIDESSMLDVDLAANVFDALLPGTHVLLIGDPGQLPPVGHGAPLRDMIAAGLPCGELTEIWRNAGAIVRACADIRAGRPFVSSRVIDVSSGENLKHLESRNATATLFYLEKLLTSTPADLDRVWDIQVLTAINDKSDLSRTALNARLQGILNAEPAIEGCPFRLKDKVICKSNTMLPIADAPEKESPQEFVANGEIGEIVHGERGMAIVRFDAPARVVRVKGEHLSDFELAYAITVHKSQGSQAKVVIYVSDDYPGARQVASRELIYTAISRAERLAFTIGRKATIDMDCRRQALAGRKTFLRELLVKGAA